MAADHQDPIDLRRLRVPEDHRTRAEKIRHRALVALAIAAYVGFWTVVAWAIVAGVDRMTS